MPRVGSKQRMVRASAAIQRAIVTFCWLPPESRCTSRWARVSICRRSMAASTRSRSGRMSSGPQARRAGAERQRDVLADRALHQQGLGAVAGDVGDAGADGVGGMGEVHRPAVDLDGAARRPDRAGERRRTARPGPGLRARRRRAPRRRGGRRRRPRAWSPTRRLRTREAGRAVTSRRRARARAGGCAARSLLDAARRASARRSSSSAPGRHVDDADGLAVAQHGGAVAERRDLEEAGAR